MVDKNLGKKVDSKRIYRLLMSTVGALNVSLNDEVAQQQDSKAHTSERPSESSLLRSSSSLIIPVNKTTSVELRN